MGGDIPLDRASREPRVMRGVILLFIGAVFIGVMPSAAKLAYANGTNPIALLIARVVIAGVGMALFLRLMRLPVAIPRRYLRKTALAGVAMLFAAGGGMSAVAYVDVSIASILFFTYPFIVAVVNHLRGETRLGPAQFGLIGLAFVGLALTLGVRLDGLDLRGVILALISSAGVAVMVLATTDTSVSLGAIRANFHMNLWAGVYFVMIALAGPAMGLTAPPQFPGSAAGWFYIVLAGISYSMGYLLFFVAATILGATRASVLSISEPVMMILVAMALVGEVLAPAQAAGVALVLASLLTFEILANRRPR